MTNNEAIRTLKANYPDACFEQLREAVDVAINALTKEAWKEEHPVSPLLQKLATNLQPSKQDDLISRQAAIEAIKTWGLIDGLSEGQAIEIIADEEKVPSAQPDLDEVYAHAETEAEARFHAERKKGRWIPQDHNKTNGMMSTLVYYYPKCSVCGHCANYTNFCPNCGADMREGAERRTDDLQ